MKLKFLLLIFLSLAVHNVIFSQSYKKWDYTIYSHIYEKIVLDTGTIDEKGKKIEIIYVPKQLNAGIYEISISGSGPLYNIYGTNYYILFSSYFGYAGYRTEGVIEVDYGPVGTFYKKP